MGLSVVFWRGLPKTLRGIARGGSAHPNAEDTLNPREREREKEEERAREREREGESERVRVSEKKRARDRERERESAVCADMARLSRTVRERVHHLALNPAPWHGGVPPPPSRVQSGPSHLWIVDFATLNMVDPRHWLFASCPELQGRY